MNGRDLVEKLMAPEPDKRLTAAQALDHPWLKFHEKQSSYCIDISVLGALRDFSKQSRLRKAACMLMSHCLSAEERKEIEDAFKLIDKTKTGTILFDEFKEVVDKLSDSRRLSSDSVPSIPHMPTVVISDVFRSINMQAEEKVYYTDFCTAVLSQQTELSSSENVLRATFDRMDVDRSGFVSVDNLRHLFGDFFEGVSIEEVLKEADYNSDGRLSFDEFLKFMRAKNIEIPVD